MKHKKTEKVLGALVVLFSLFIRECRGGRDSFSTEEAADPMIGGGRTIRQRNELDHSHADQAGNDNEVLDLDEFNRPLNPAQNILENYDQHMQQDHTQDYSEGKKVGNGADSTVEPTGAEGNEIEEPHIDYIGRVPDIPMISDNYENIKYLQRKTDHAMPESSADKDSPNDVYEVLDTSGSKKIERKTTESPTIDSGEKDKTAPSYGLLTEIDGNDMQDYLLSQEDMEIVSASKEAINNLDNRSTMPYRAEKRTADEMHNSIGELDYQYIAKDKRRREECTPGEIGNFAYQDGIGNTEEEEYVSDEIQDVVYQDDIETTVEEDTPNKIGNIFDQDDVENMVEDDEPKDLNHKELNLNRALFGKIEMKDLDISIWNDTRLKNIGRLRRRMNYNTLCDHKYAKNDLIIGANAKPYQASLKAAIYEYSKLISRGIKKNEVQYFVGISGMNVSLKYKTLLGLRKLFMDRKSIYRKMVKKFKGYYPNVIEDMIVYVEEHQPIRILIQNPQTVWKRTLGDIYMSECLKMDYSVIRNQKEISTLDKKYHALAYAINMIITLPEVYQDFLEISREFINYTYDKYSLNPAEDMNNLRIILIIQELVYLHEEKAEYSTFVYSNLYSTLENIHNEEMLQNLTATDLYQIIYKIIADFYDMAEVVDKKYILAGKCIIKNQKYIKCRVRVNMASEDESKKILKPTYSFEKNKWEVSSDIKTHYHVHYVDNTLGQPRRLCMPIYKEEGSEEEHYLHTIGDMVKYIKKLYRIKKELNVIYPFKVDKKSKIWNYIKKEDENKTAKDLKDYDIVFYHIKENIEVTDFTFAQFLSLISYSEKSGTTLIPLFVTHLMQDAIKSGPFITTASHENLKLIELKDKNPDFYRYNYASYVNLEHSCLFGYYSNLYILPDEIKSTECYVMQCQFIEQANGAISVVSYAKMPGDVDEYTHCVLNEDFKRDSEEFDAFIETIESRDHNEDSKLQGFWLRSDRKNNSLTIQGLLEERNTLGLYGEDDSLEILRNMIINAKKRLKKIEENLIQFKEFESIEEKELKNKWQSLQREKSIEQDNLKELNEKVKKKLSEVKKTADVKIIVFRNVNSSRSNLGAHNELLDVFITLYRQPKDRSK
ncbi:hypothetical protein NEMIN01_1003 [Nematocida minor]|uniref:uncharacterized protein n=1 Tax=Nematocida minor TaxID=1912983 RepID=UPI00221F1898|nr:uncharacterized protein NEMIN01_1003 [Nematocida minor]KAI5190379.1 hypothetical protein NEMIN01_1003 [Nematocida minor]